MEGEQWIKSKGAEERLPWEGTASLLANSEMIFCRATQDWFRFLFCFLRPAIYSTCQIINISHNCFPHLRLTSLIYFDRTGVCLHTKAQVVFSCWNSCKKFLGRGFPGVGAKRHFSVRWVIQSSGQYSSSAWANPTEIRVFRQRNVVISHLQKRTLFTCFQPSTGRAHSTRAPLIQGRAQEQEISIMSASGTSRLDDYLCSPPLLSTEKFSPTMSGDKDL